MKQLYIFLLVMTIVRSGLAQKETFSAADLGEWDFYGMGRTVVDNHDLFLIKEAEHESRGAMIISPKSYGENVVLEYDVMSLTPATVCVAMMSLSDYGDDTQLTVAEGYDGANGKWGNDGSQCYFFVFRNEAHNHHPFLRKRSKPEDKEAPRFVDYYHKNVMKNGIFHHIEVGRKGGNFWLKIDGKKILSYKDDKPYGGGHLAIRIRGTAGEYASCFIRNVVITETD